MTGQQDRSAKLIEVLKKSLGVKSNVHLFNAEVKSVQGESCTVAVGDLELTDVRLKATINEASDYLMQIPAVGSMVLCGDMSGGDLREVCVLKIDKLEKLVLKQSGLDVLIDTTDGKIHIENEGPGLLQLFNALADILKTLKVFTPAGPSGTPLATTITKIQQFETNFKQLLK